MAITDRRIYHPPAIAQVIACHHPGPAALTIAVFRIDRLALHARHGTRPEERSLGQRFFLDLVVTADIGGADRSDRIEESVHYGDVIKAATAVFIGRDFNLIEAAAAAVGDDLLERFERIRTVSVTVHKPAAPVAAILDDISATVERRRDD